MATSSHDFTTCPNSPRASAAALADELPSSPARRGHLPRRYHPELDELRAAERGGKDWIAALQEREVQRTGIASLKIRYNSVFGYYIEITKSNSPASPPTTGASRPRANGERFVTPELKEMEARILGAEERARQLEYELFGELRDEVLTSVRPLQENGHALATLDALASFAEVARLGNYCRPLLRDDAAGPIRITAGRHPVLDAHAATAVGGGNGLDGGRFVPKTCCWTPTPTVSCSSPARTWPAKVPTCARSPLLVLMAQVGSYLPAESAEITLVDASSPASAPPTTSAGGQSTFLVEMNETAHILHHATARSLVILDEIGRGTSTYDGLSIAWSCRRAPARRHRRPHALRHALPRADGTRRTHPGVQNLTVAVREWNDEIVFLHRIVPGAADKSYASRSPAWPACPPRLSSAPRASSPAWSSEAAPPPRRTNPRSAPSRPGRRRAAAAATAEEERRRPGRS